MRLFSTMLAASIAPLLIAAQAPANGPASAPQPDARVSLTNKVICKKFPPPTGTRMGPRQICKTQVEWDLIRHEEWDALDRVQGRKSYSGG